MREEREMMRPQSSWRYRETRRKKVKEKKKEYTTEAKWRKEENMERKSRIIYEYMEVICTDIKKITQPVASRAYTVLFLRIERKVCPWIVERFLMMKRVLPLILP